MKLIITVFFTYFFACSFLFGQKEVFSFNVDQKSKLIKKQTYALTENINNDLAIFIQEMKTLRMSLFDKNFNLKSEFEFNIKKNKHFKEFLGYKSKGEIYSLVFSNSLVSRFNLLNINFRTKTVSFKVVDAGFFDEMYLSTISHNNELYVLSSTKDNDIVIRTLNENYEFEVLKLHSLDLHKKQKLQKGFSQNSILFPTSKSSNVTKIDNRVPGSIELTSQNNKIYKQDNKLYLTFDGKTDSTLMFIISLTDFSIDRKEFVYPKGKIDDFKKQNSYFLDDKLFQIASSKKEITLVAKTLDDGIINSYYFNKEKSIDIKNSNIIQEGKTALPFVTTREFTETSKFLRKISSGSIGVSGYKKDAFYHFIIGGTKEVSNGPPITFSGPSSANLGNSNIVITTYNPTFTGYSTSTSTKSTYFNTTFDFSFKHVKDKTQGNVFQKIKAYSKSLKHISAENVFFYKDQLFFGYYDMDIGKYNLINF